MKMVVLSAAHAPSSGTTRLGMLIGEVASSRLPELSVEHLELRGIACNVTRSLIEGTLLDATSEAVRLVREADALTLLTPTINASFSGLLKSFLDVLPRDVLRGVPTLMGATGGTHRHTLVLDQSVRPMLAFLRAVVLPSALFVTADEWHGALPSPGLRHRIERGVDELSCFLRLGARQTVGA